MYFGVFTSSAASFSTSSGIVAEKSSVCRTGGSCETMRWTSGQKPMSIMRSASSSTSTSSGLKSGVCRPHVIHQPARRRDDDVGAGPERAVLRLHRDAAVDHGARDRACDRAGPGWRPRSAPPARASAPESARACPDRACRLQRAAMQSLQDRQHERGGLPRARLGRRDDVVAGQRVGEDGALNRAGFLEAEVGDAARELRMQAEGGEGDGGRVVGRLLADRIGRRRAALAPSTGPCAAGGGRGAPRCGRRECDGSVVWELKFNVRGR